MEHKGNFSHNLTLDELAVFLPAVIFGAEGETDGAGEPTGDQSNNDGAGSDDDKDEPKDDGKTDEDTSGLKSALAKERSRAAAAEKALKAELKTREARELAEKSDLEKAQINEQKATERAERLSSGLLQRDLNDAIRTAAKAAGFIDVTDAIDGVDRTALSYTQDSDDPTNIEIDAKSIEAEVKKLATKKPHFIRSGTDDGEPTGSQFGGSAKKKTTTEDDLKKKYPALR